MNKKILNLVILAVALGGLIAAYFLFFNEKKGTSFSDEEFQFSVKDTSAIQNIKLEKIVRDSLAQTLTLERMGGHWKLNDRFIAEQSQVNNMLVTLSRLTPVAVLTDAGKQTSLKRLKTSHTQVEIRGAEGVMKRFKIGGTNKDQTGNVMLMEGAKDPAVIAREGMLGYVSIYFTTNEKRWRDRTLISEHPEALSSVSVDYREAPQGSFMLSKGSTGAWMVGEGIEADSARLYHYLSFFLKSASFESFAGEVYPQMVDSLKNQPADIQISYTNQLGLKKTVSLFQRGPEATNYFGKVEGENELLTVQKYVIDSFLVSVDYFVPRPL